MGGVETGFVHEVRSGHDSLVIVAGESGAPKEVLKPFLDMVIVQHKFLFLPFHVPEPVSIHPLGLKHFKFIHQDWRVDHPSLV